LNLPIASINPPLFAVFPETVQRQQNPGQLGRKVFQGLLVIIPLTLAVTASVRAKTKSGFLVVGD